jgi:NAD(P)-dependent dehydrogenase (short-subunit alcohol dehydrogenase family)
MKERELAKREGGNGIIAHAMHPGTAATNFSSHAAPEMRAHLARADKISPDIGGRTLMWLASSPEAGASTGDYFFDCAPVELAPIAKDAEAAARLWKDSEALLAQAGW